MFPLAGALNVNAGRREERVKPSSPASPSSPIQRELYIFNVKCVRSSHSAIFKDL